ncbi:MAG: hypothetical protein LC127_13135, partial [Chitinophagales bacterium]|nr:hypothetical protein [Chitinophagales bacterium]
VWMPRYICNSMLEPLKKARIECVFYGIGKDFSILNEIDLCDDEWILYVNYFGVCESQEREVLRRFNPKQIILDHSQAFFIPPFDCLATIYSPRKFFGIPDGGLLITEMSMPDPEFRDTDSIQRSLHLLKRLDSGAESGYADYQIAEKSLENFTPKKMSVLTDAMLSSIDYEYVRSRRNKNFRILHDALGQYNQIKLSVNSINGPLCYPFFSNAENSRSNLIKQRIYAATYWPECIGRSMAASPELSFVKGLIPLTCDQRYRENELIKIINIIGAGK